MSIKIILWFIQNETHIRNAVNVLVFRYCGDEALLRFDTI